MAACDGCKKEGELDGYQKCGIAEFKNALDKEVNPQILDYRSAEDFANGHIKGAINIDATSTGQASFQHPRKSSSTENLDGTLQVCHYQDV